MTPSSVERNMRRATRPMSRIDRVPTTAAEKRQPKEESTPKIHWPTAIIHLPTGGWTTKSPAVSKTSGVPAVNRASGVLPSAGSLRSSTPCCSSDHACLT